MDLDGIEMHPIFFQLGWNLDGDWPIRRQNPYQHQFVGGCIMDFSKWWLEILHEIEYLVFHNYFVFFRKTNGFFRNSRFPVRSVFVIINV